MTTPPDDRNDLKPDEKFQAGTPPPSLPPGPRPFDDRQPRPAQPAPDSNRTMWIVLSVSLVVLLLVVVGVVGMLFMGVGRVRDSAARLQTNNNLKQCALAVHSFHDNFNKFPPGFGKGGQIQASDASMWVHLLPFVEQAPLYNTLANQGPQGGGVAYTAMIPPYLAPRDEYATTNAGIVSFAGNVRIFAHKTLEANKQPVNVPGSAVEVPAGTMLSGLQLQRIKDGTENVIMLSTRYSQCGGKTTWFAVDAHGKWNQSLPPSPGMGGFMGGGSATTPATAAGPLTATFQYAPTERECLPNAGVFGHALSARGLSVALCDSAVRELAPSISPQTFSRALCPGDGEKLDADWRIDD